MNITNLDIQTWSKQVSEDFIQNKVSLNEGITKIAQDQGLNQQQINRLVERANAMTYVSLMNNVKDKERYIEFPVAESTKIAKAIDFQESSADLLEDYREPPEQFKKEDIKLSELFPEVDEQKEAKLTDKEKRLIKKAALDAFKKVESTKRELAVVFDIESDKFIKQVKQASISPYTSFHTITGHFKSLDDAISSVLLPLIKEAGNRIPESYRTQIIEDEDFDFNEMEKQGKYLIQITTAYKNLENNQDEIVKQAAERQAFGPLGTASKGLFAGTGKLLQAASKSRLAMLALLGIPIAGAGIAATGIYAAGKEKGKQETSPLKQVPPRYNKWRA